MRRATLIMAILLVVAGAWAWWGISSDHSAAPATQAVSRAMPQEGWGPLRLMTANIRVDQPTDGDNAWVTRRGAVVKTFLKHMPDILACQEVSAAQGAYLNRELSTWYSYYPRAGVGIQDAPTQSGGSQIRSLLGETLGALATVYYRNDRFTAIDGEAGLIIPEELQAKPTDNAIFTLVVLRENVPAERHGTAYIVMDAHLRHNTSFATRCAERLREKLAVWRKKVPAAMVIVMGDFNHDHLQAPCTVLTGQAGQGSADGAPRLIDTFDYASKPAGERWGNWHLFVGKPQREWPTDLILVDQDLQVIQPAVLLKEQTDGRWPSDHWFVVTQVRDVKSSQHAP